VALRKVCCEKVTPPRGPLTGDWISRLREEKKTPLVCIYKLISIEFKWFGLQTQVESFMAGYEHRLFNLFHRKIFCRMDKWIDMSLEDIR